MSNTFSDAGGDIFSFMAKSGIALIIAAIAMFHFDIGNKHSEKRELVLRNHKLDTDIRLFPELHSFVHTTLKEAKKVKLSDLNVTADTAEVRNKIIEFLHNMSTIRAIERKISNTKTAAIYILLSGFVFAAGGLYFWALRDMRRYAKESRKLPK